jgi:hypothetical protein
MIVKYQQEAMLLCSEFTLNSRPHPSVCVHQGFIGNETVSDANNNIFAYADGRGIMYDLSIGASKLTLNS